MFLALLLCYGGFTLLCLSMDRHHSDLLGRKPSARRRQALRLSGWVLLALSLWAAVAATGWSLGLVQWCAVLMLSALLLVLLMPYQPRLALFLAGLGLLTSALVTFVQF